MTSCRERRGKKEGARRRAQQISEEVRDTGTTTMAPPSHPKSPMAMSGGERKPVTRESQLSGDIHCGTNSPLYTSRSPECALCQGRLQQVIFTVMPLGHLKMKLGSANIFCEGPDTSLDFVGHTVTTLPWQVQKQL